LIALPGFSSNSGAPSDTFHTSASNVSFSSSKKPGREIFANVETVCAKALLESNRTRECWKESGTYA
jgi:hypothetical protein